MNRVDPVLYLLLIVILSFTGMLVFVEFKFPNDGQLFQVISGMVTGFSGAFLLRVKPQTKEEEKGPGAKVTEVEKTSTILTSVPGETSENKP